MVEQYKVWSSCVGSVGVGVVWSSCVPGDVGVVDLLYEVYSGLINKPQAAAQTPALLHMLI